MGFWREAGKYSSGGNGKTKAVVAALHFAQADRLRLLFWRCSTTVPPLNG